MGGPGSGRYEDPVKKLIGFNQPAPTGPDSMYIPNVSSVKPEAVKGGSYGAAGGVIFVGSTGQLAQDNPNLFWDNANNRLGIGTTGPGAKLHVSGSSGNQMRMEYSSGGYASLGWFEGTSGHAFIEYDDNPNKLYFYVGDGTTKDVTIDSTGNVGIGTTSPTAVLHLKACAAAANTASLKIDAGTVATTPVSGNIESDGTHLYWTDSGGTRRQLDN